MISETHAPRRRLRSEGLRTWFARKDAASFYGLFAVLVVASVQTFFSLQKGGFFPEQWYWGMATIVATLLGAALVPGYLSSSSVGRGQWALAGMLILLMVVVAASILWSISPFLSVLEASRTAMYVGAFVLLLPAVARWGFLLADITLFGALLPQAIYGLLQKILPAYTEYTGFSTLDTDPAISATAGYHPTFGMMCAMGTLLVVARVGAFRSLRLVPLRALYSATGTLFLVALYFSFSSGALLSLAVGTVVLLFLATHRFEVLVNMTITVLPALWVVWQAREYPGLVASSVSLEVRETDGLAFIGPLITGVLLALIAQLVFAVLVRTFVRVVPEQTRSVLRITSTMAAAGVLVFGLFLGWNAFQQAGGYNGLVSQITTPERSSATDSTTRLASISAANRIVLWEIAWENWREHTLTGTGGDTYQIVFEEKEGGKRYRGSVLHPHSMWMSLLSDTGIFAFLAFTTFSVGCLALACYNAFFAVDLRSRALIAGSAAAAAAYLVSSSVDWNWYIPASTLPFFALAAVAVGISPRRATAAKAPERELPSRRAS